MTRSFRLFISSSPDLAAERDALGQAVAGLPVSIGWEIRHTPAAGEDAREALAFIEGCDVFVLVLGMDFAAPMGLEWERALKTARPALTYRKSVAHSPAAQSLLRWSNVGWTEFASPPELKVRAARALAQLLLDRGEQFGLHVDDVTALWAEVHKEEQEVRPEPDQRRGAGKSGVIFGREG